MCVVAFSSVDVTIICIHVVVVCVDVGGVSYIVIDDDVVVHIVMNILDFIVAYDVTGVAVV